MRLSWQKNFIGIQKSGFVEEISAIVQKFPQPWVGRVTHFYMFVGILMAEFEMFSKQAGAELGQAQLKLGMGFTSASN